MFRFTIRSTLPSGWRFSIISRAVARFSAWDLAPWSPTRIFLASPTEKLYPMMAESVDIIVRLLESPDPIDIDGQYWKLKQMRLQLRSYQQPRMPLAIASSGNPISLELAGKYGMLFLSPAGKIKRNNQSKAQQWNAVEASAAKHGGKLRATTGGMATCVYLAENREEAWRDVEANIDRDKEYFFSIGLKAPYEVLPWSTGT